METVERFLSKNLVKLLLDFELVLSLVLFTDVLGRFLYQNEPFVKASPEFINSMFITFLLRKKKVENGLKSVEKTG